MISGCIPGSLGHIKGAKNIPLGAVVDQDKLQLKTLDELKEGKLFLVYW